MEDIHWIVIHSLKAVQVSSKFPTPTPHSTHSQPHHTHSYTTHSQTHHTHSYTTHSQAHHTLTATPYTHSFLHQHHTLTLTATPHTHSYTTNLTLTDTPHTPTPFVQSQPRTYPHPCTHPTTQSSYHILSHPHPHSHTKHHHPQIPTTYPHLPISTPHTITLTSLPHTLTLTPTWTQCMHRERTTTHLQPSSDHSSLLLVF